jgi:hypothetical protein
MCRRPARFMLSQSQTMSGLNAWWRISVKSDVRNEEASIDDCLKARLNRRSERSIEPSQLRAPRAAHGGNKCAAVACLRCKRSPHSATILALALEDMRSTLSNFL